LVFVLQLGLDLQDEHELAAHLVLFWGAPASVFLQQNSFLLLKIVFLGLLQQNSFASL
jgi:hypothetical protein